MSRTVDMDQTNQPDRRFATTLARGLKVLGAFRASDTALGNQEISKRTNLPKSTVSRLTFTLSQLGYLDHLKSIEKYRLGPSVLALGNVAYASLPFLDAANGFMQELANETGTLVALTVRNGFRMLYAHCWRPVDAAAIWLEVGHQIPIHRTASGLAFLAGMPDDALKRLLAAMDAEGVAGAKNIEASVAAARAELITHGFVTSIGSWVKTINAVAVPFRYTGFSETLVFNCGALKESLSPERITTEVGPRLRTRVHDLETAMGQQSPMVAVSS